jgi:RNA-directed DNA polymerase
MSRRAGDRLTTDLGGFITDRLKLKVNGAKSAVDVPQKRRFLGFTITGGRLVNRRKIAPELLRRFKARVRQLTRRNWSISLEERIRRLATYLLGWRGYFGLCETGSVLRGLYSWIRHRLRCVQWKQCKIYGWRKEELTHLGVSHELAHIRARSAK